MYLKNINELSTKKLLDRLERAHSILNKKVSNEYRQQLIGIIEQIEFEIKFREEELNEDIYYEKPKKEKIDW